LKESAPRLHSGFRNYARLEAELEEYRELSRNPKASSKMLARLETQIMNTDTEIALAARCDAVAASVVYLYFRLGWNSVSVAEELGLKAPHVRQMVQRIRRSAARLNLEAPAKEAA
jgi:hypothetical protein